MALDKRLFSGIPVCKKFYLQSGASGMHSPPTQSVVLNFWTPASDSIPRFSSFDSRIFNFPFPFKFIPPLSELNLIQYL